MKNRSSKLEKIDLGPPHYTPKQYRNCLYQLDRVGRFLGGDRASFWAFKQLKKPPESILDVGCGGGLFTQRLAKHYPKAKVTGIDLSREAIDFAKRHLPPNDLPQARVNFSVSDSASLDYPSHSFDVVTATLVCHHLKDCELVEFLRQAVRVAKQAVILNDLHRHSLAWLGFAAIMPFFFPNRLVWHDGLLSIRRSFTCTDWITLLNEANIPLNRCSINWHWAFRWTVTIDTSEPFDANLMRSNHET